MLRRRLGPVLVVVLCVLVAEAAPAGAASAIHPSNRPTPIAGHENGRLPQSELITVAPGCEVARAAGPSLRLILDHAQHRSAPLGLRDCYRPIDEQVAVSQTWTSRGNSACAAQPQYYPDGRPKGTSMHGWGKAADFSRPGGRLTFDSDTYRFLTAYAGRTGWNHPGWAQPGGSACPEPWHWEWVGDGGTMGADPVRADVVDVVLPPGGGHTLVTGLGGAEHHGGAADHGDVRHLALRWVVVGAAGVPGGGGYWMVGADGGVFSLGAAGFHGSTGGMRLNKPVVGMAATPSGAGYWLVASDGGVFSFGDAAFHGSTGGMPLNKPIVGMAATPSGAGYWLVASDGGVFSFGDAAFHGSTGGMHLNEPVVGMAATPDGDGYWLVASDGGVFTFGAAPFRGSAGDEPRSAFVVALSRTADGGGYTLVAADGWTRTFPS